MRALVVAASIAAMVVLAAPSASSAPAASFTKDDVLVPMDDGATIAATLYLPGGSPPTGGWPALVFLHGLSGNRGQMNALVESYGFAGGAYAVLTFDARGHGVSTGLVSIDGPREIADVRALVGWLAARPDVAGNRIGAWGISYGGGAILNSLVAGVPWRAVTAVETWTDLYAALVPNGVVKTGLVAGLAGSIPEARKSPELKAVQALAFSRPSSPVLRTWAAARSSISRLGRVRTPVFMAQGRRDFLFGIDQGTRAFARLAGPKMLYLGRHGHPPSTFPASDTGYLMTQSRRWFDCYLRGLPCTAVPRVEIAADGGGARLTTMRLPPTTTATTSFGGSRTITQRGRVVRTGPRLPHAVEVFGSPTVTVRATTKGGWSRLIAVLTARTPDGAVVTVANGGTPTAASGTRAYRIPLEAQVTAIPRGSRLQLTLGSSSSAQHPGNLTFLDLPMPAGASVRVQEASVSLPTLRATVTRR